MNNLHYIKQTGWNTLMWSLGINNLTAARDVICDEYKHHEWPTTRVKIKQIGTEILHVGAKALAWDKLFFSNIFSGPVIFDLTKHVKAPDLTVITNNITENTLALAAIGYSGKHLYSNTTTGFKHFWKTIQWDYNHNPILYLGDLGKSMAYFANAALVVPVGLCGYEHGPAAGAAAATTLLALNHIGKLATVGKYAASPAGAASVGRFGTIERYGEITVKTALIVALIAFHKMYGSAPV